MATQPLVAHRLVGTDSTIAHAEKGQFTWMVLEFDASQKDNSGDTLTLKNVWLTPRGGGCLTREVSPFGTRRHEIRAQAVKAEVRHAL